jgi:hypothetical protein
MFPALHPDTQLAEIRERHARIRADVERSRYVRLARGRYRYRFRSRQRHL